jgi:glutathione S-transferase
MNALRLVSHHLCPYVQRAAIALDEKGVAFDRVQIDLANKPDWFKAISPLGKVPLLHVTGGGEEAVLFESAVILEYLEETAPHPLHPRDPLTRAMHRSWIEFGSAILGAIWRFYTAKDADALATEAGKLAGMFDRIEATLGEAPWFAGQDFTLVDAAYAPVFRYFDTFDSIGDFGILSNKPKARAWRERLAERPSVRRAVTPDYAKRLTAFLLARNSELSARIPGTAASG